MVGDATEGKVTRAEKAGCAAVSPASSRSCTILVETHSMRLHQAAFAVPSRIVGDATMVFFTTGENVMSREMLAETHAMRLYENVAPPRRATAT